jgi:MFS transporter, DHA2 family, methylenomycin A resistance protein
MDHNMQRSSRAKLVSAIYLGTFMATLDVSIVNLALPAIQADLKTSLAGLQWVIDAYALCLTAFMLSAGPLGDRYGRKCTWLIGVGLFIGGSLLCGLSTGLPGLLAGRAVQGIAGSMLIPGALSILAQAYPEPRSRASIIGGWSSFSAISLILGPILGGMLVEHAGWPSIFLINIPIGLLTLYLGIQGIRENSDPEHAALDIGGQALSIGWLGALTYGLISAGEEGWLSAHTMLSGVAAILSFIAFLVVETRAPRPLLPLFLFRDLRFTTASLACFILGFTAYGSLFFLSLFLQKVLGSSPQLAGWQLTPQFTMAAVASAGFGHLVRRTGVENLMIAGFLLIGTSMLAMSCLGPMTPYIHVAIPLGLLGIGMGLAVPATSAAIMNLVPSERSGMASATLNTIRQSGMTLGVALLGSIMTTQALSAMTEELNDLHIAGALSIAEAAIRANSFGELANETTIRLFQASISTGFNMVMAISGVSALLTTLILFSTRTRQEPSEAQRMG